MLTPRGIVALVLVVWISGFVALVTTGYVLYSAYQNIETRLASSQGENATLTDELFTTKAENMIASQKLAQEVARSSDLETKVSTMSSTVDTLTKLSETDKELLQKYSRVYFLNENYLPADLTTIASEFTLQPSRTYKILTRVNPYLQSMLIGARDDGYSLLVLSGYRSFGEQAALKTNYKVTYGIGSNKFSADQGYSEHQLATAVDLTTKELGGTTLAFARTPAYAWLSANAYRYGFVLSYPSGNTFYQYEPWHWRFVGVELATKLHNENKNFYEIPQREIDTFLLHLFD